jgi:hypothetical protein
MHSGNARLKGSQSHQLQLEKTPEKSLKTFTENSHCNDRYSHRFLPPSPIPPRPHVTTTPLDPRTTMHHLCVWQRQGFTPRRCGGAAHLFSS